MYINIKVDLVFIVLNMYLCILIIGSIVFHLKQDDHICNFSLVKSLLS